MAGPTPRSFEFCFDFGSPTTSVAHRRLPGLLERSGAEVVYVPVLLGGIFKATGNVSPAVSLQGIRNKGEYQRIETERYCKAHGISPQVPNPHFPVNTLKMMRGAVFARDKDYYGKYIDAMYEAMWEQARKMDEDDLIRETLESAGLPADEIIEGMSNPEVKQALIDSTESSVGRGTFGSPTLFVGDEIFFGKDKLRDAVEFALA